MKNISVCKISASVMRLIRFLFYLSCLVSLNFIFPATQAQQFPVQVITEIIPPYSVYLSEYTIPGANKLGINIMLTQLDRFNYQVKLRVIIEGEGITISTSPNYMPAPIILDGGLPLRLDGNDVAAYLDARNLDFQGYSKEKFMLTGALPEGIYRIGFQVLDYHKSIPVSLTGSTLAWLVLNDPPIINMPEKNAKLIATEPQSIMFQWLPRHVGSPNSAFNAEYVFQLFEIWPAGRNPNEVVQSTQPLIEKVQTQTTFIYSNTQEISLEPGRQYAIRVQARDMEGRDLFRNHGYSEVQMFTYGDPCDCPDQIMAEATGQDQIRISWQPALNNTNYYLQYREAGKPGAEWFPKNSNINNVVVDNLKTGTKYEYQVKGYCGSLYSDFSDIQTITTQSRKKTDFVCGLRDTSLASLSQLPLTSLLPGDIITSGEFDVQITKAEGGNGRWTGEGIARIPFMDFLKVRVKFDNISINDKNQVLSGRINSIYNPDSRFVAHIEIEEPEEDDAEVVDSTTIIESSELQLDNIIIIESLIDHITRTEDRIVIHTEDGDSIVITRSNVLGELDVILPSGETRKLDSNSKIGITDSEGNTTVIDGLDNQPKKKDFEVLFDYNKNQNYGFDRYYPQYYPGCLVPKELYEYYDDPVTKTTYYYPWKSVRVGEYDKVNVRITPEEDKYRETEIVVKDYLGVEQTLIPTDNDFVKEFQISGPYTGLPYQYTVSYKDSEEEEHLSDKLNVVSYEENTYYIYLVPVNGRHIRGSNIDLDILEEGLDNVYKQACVNFKIIETNGIDNYTYQSVDPSSGKDEYYIRSNKDMPMLAKILKDRGDCNDHDYYLFLLDEMENSNIAGFMTRSGQFGSIFTLKNWNDANIYTLAHELGHGIVGFKDSFDDWGLHTKGRTINLMDYTGNYNLLKYQWDLIHEQGGVILEFPGLEPEVEAYVSGNSAEDIARIINHIKCSKNKQQSLVNIYYSEELSNAHIGLITDILNRNNSTKTSSGKLTDEYFTVFISEEALPSINMNPLKILEGYDCIEVDLSKATYDQSSITIPAKEGNGRIVFGTSFLYSSETQKQIIEWLVGELGLNGKQTNYSVTGVQSNYKAEDLILLSECELEQISRVEREKLIAELVKNQETFFGLDKDTYQYLLINLLNTIPTVDESYFYSLLKNNPYWIVGLYENLASVYKTRLIQIISELWILNDSKNAKDEIDKVYRLVYSILGKPSNYLSFSSDGKVVNTGIAATLFGPGFPEESFEANLFEPVVINLSNDINGKSIILPAICVKYYADKGYQENMIASLNIMANVALCFVGVEEVAAGLRAAKVVKGISGLASKEFLSAMAQAILGVGMVGSSASSITCVLTENEFCKIWKEYEAAVNLGLMSASFANTLFRKLSMSYTQEVYNSLSATDREVIKRMGITITESGVKAGDDILKYIDVTDFNSLNQVTSVSRSGGIRAINNVKNLVNEGKSLVIIPEAESQLAKKVDDYLSAFAKGDSKLQGELGEEIAEMLSKEIDNTTTLNIKINNSGHGFDVMQFENGIENPTVIRIFESKPINGTSVLLPSTNTGTQMGSQWENAKIQDMLSSTNEEIRRIGQILDKNQHLIEKYVVTIDKDLEQVIILRLDKF